MSLIDNISATDDRFAQGSDQDIKFIRKVKVMLQEKDDTVAPTVLVNPSGDEAGKLLTADRSAVVINFLAVREQLSAEFKLSHTTDEPLPNIAGLTFKRKHQARFVDPFEEGLYWLISAAALGYLALVILSL
jgi:hypothetical protein